MSWVHTSDSTPRAAKPYRCIGCDTLIEKGEVHHARRGFTDDSPVTFRSHLECSEFMDAQHRDDSGFFECHSPGDFTREEARASIKVPE